MPSLSDPIISISGLGQKTADRLNQLGIHTLEHLLFHLPSRYQDKTTITSLSSANVEEEILIEVTIDRIEVIPARQRQLLCYLSDNQNQRVLLRFFHFTQYQKQALIRGETIQCFGEIKIGRQGLEMHHPEYRIISQDQKPLLESTLTPVYPLCAGVSQNKMKQWVNNALDVLKANVIDDYFEKITQSTMPSLKDSLFLLHHPNKNEDLSKIEAFTHISQQRLIIEELAAHQLSLLKIKEARKSKESKKISIKNALSNKLLSSLEFDLTSAQSRCISQINEDLSSSEPMHRLLQGDVGSGKTIVAVFALLQAAENNFQTAVMAPTEILARQHLQNFSNYLTPLGIQIAFLSGSQNTQERKDNLSLIENGKAKVIIGTHALFQENVYFEDLALVIIDEQHKFGVHQRLSLSKKASLTPHQLVMTATPIPRSLTMSAYADLDTSIIDELPPGRQTIETVALSNARRDELITKIEQISKEGRQIYWVCTLIEESEALRAESAEKTFTYLTDNLRDLKVVMIHGRLTKSEKEIIMSDFSSGKTNLLVATTVIEVGVNVPNASLMIVENAERLGLAQLHQLRGRVGRGSEKSACVLLYQSPLSQTAKERLDILRQSNDGFLIAQKDLELRGPGEILGTQQTGIASMKIADIVRDSYLLKQVGYYSSKMLEAEHTSQNALMTRWIDEEKTHYFDA
ncbi:MAG: ATP-dependent DNA helicase RecG [Gammaproteobacteria bacterium]|jgi:ATP-dependent DNA helicase RecG|nr:ATP-dependent DNA helicase RecG [Gammaproteobacteria bacterium]MDP0560199.1 ATP-dependent DNA helicase RecG [Candidatus Thioglobus sp.]MBT4586491.1 ATP-dependent DNA helicase RecG [Gammaproteobacteria bacterium]MBT4974087.1 ATP-dependent DNA helicase RecG [Gammaproteobacteria bacterium]MBT7390981.1 ATP-dependent DNA helicase RecG [Gammaproteobacteria bacterium]